METRRLGWLDCSSGVSGDMLLGALVAAGVPMADLQAAVDAVAPERVRLLDSSVRRAGLAATLVDVQCAPSNSRRSWPDIRRLLEDAAGLSDPVRVRALHTFERLAAAEARVHGVSPAEVHFHEVGALDAIADVVAVCAGFAALNLERLSASPVALGSGVAGAAHGRLPVPAPAVVELLAGVPTYGGGPEVELATPTGAALLVEHVSSWGPQPAMRVARQSCGAGARDLPGRPNVVRLLVGAPAEPFPAPARSGPAGRSGGHRPGTPSLLLEANVDDLDPRLWPAVLTRLLEAGAADAWLVPILMKKGRPAHTLCVLVDADRAGPLREVMFRETSTIGLREHPVEKHPLDRHTHSVIVDGRSIRIKVASLDGLITNVQPEYDDIAAVAQATGRPLKSVLTEALRQAQSELLITGAGYPPGDDR